MAVYAQDDTYDVLTEWGIRKLSALWEILAPRTALEAQADLETMVQYFGMVPTRSRKGWQPSNIPLFSEGLRFISRLGSEIDDN